MTSCNFISGKCPYISPCKDGCPVAPAMFEERLVPRFDTGSAEMDAALAADEQKLHDLGAFDNGQPDETKVDDQEPCSLRREFEAALADLYPTKAAPSPCPQYVDGQGFVDMTNVFDRERPKTPTGGRPQPINDEFCAVGACRFIGECGKVELDFETGDGGCLASCIWGAAAQGDEACVKRVLEEYPEGADVMPTKEAPSKLRQPPILSTEDSSLNPKDIAGRSKPQLGLIPTNAMVPIARVMELGARKYGPYNWRYKPIGMMTYLHAMKRHIEDVINGVDIDPESDEPHLAHVASGAMIVLDAQAKGTLREDRPTVIEIKPEVK